MDHQPVYPLQLANNSQDGGLGTVELAGQICQRIFSPAEKEEKGHLNNLHGRGAVGIEFSGHELVLVSRKISTLNSRWITLFCSGLRSHRVQLSRTLLETLEEQGGFHGLFIGQIRKIFNRFGIWNGAVKKCCLRE
jgi:hypothetical protein